MTLRAGRAIAATLIAMIAGTLSPAARAEVDSGVIRLSQPETPSEAPAETATEPELKAGARRSFDVEAFDGRFESLWFQRKAYHAQGREEDATRQTEMIRDFVAEEGVRRLELPAGAHRSWHRGAMSSLAPSACLVVVG